MDRFASLAIPIPVLISIPVRAGQGGKLDRLVRSEDKMGPHVAQRLEDRIVVLFECLGRLGKFRPWNACSEVVLIATDGF